MDRPEREAKEAQHRMMVGFEMRIDDWRNKYHCKKVPHSAFKKVVETMGMLPEKWDDRDCLAAFFEELRNQRPDLFSHGKSTKQQPTQSGCLVLLIGVLAIVAYLLRKSTLS